MRITLRATPFKFKSMHTLGCALIGDVLHCAMVPVLCMNHCRRQWHLNALRVYRLLSLSPSPPYLELTQEDLGRLPVARFTGDCIVIRTPEDEQKYSSTIDCLFRSSVLGFDTEWHHWRPRRAPALVQLATEDVCVMWRLCYTDQENLFVGKNFPPKLLHLLTSKTITKVCLHSLFTCTCVLENGV